MASASKKPAGPALVSKDEPPKQKTKLTRPLPFDRVAVMKQLETLRGYAATSLQGAKAVTNLEVAAMVGLASETISTCNGFFASVGLIQKGERGGWIVSAEVVDYFRAFEWNKATAAHKLAPIMQSSWFGQALTPTLSFKQTLDEDEAVEMLALKAPAGTEHRRALRMLVEYLEASGVIQRDGKQLKPGTAPIPETPRQESQTAPASEPPAQRPKVATAFSQMAQGTMRFNVSFDVDLSEMANWRPDRIAAFFSGMAQVLAAKAEVEKTARD